MIWMSAFQFEAYHGWILHLVVIFLSFFPVSSIDEIPRSKHTDSIAALLSESLKNHRAQACEGQRLSLKCPAHTVILVETTFYGRLVPSNELCPPSEKQLRNKLEKIENKKPLLWEEKYEDTSCDVTNAHTKVVEKCQNRRKCRVHARPHFFGRDPCPTTSKYLQISYKCKPSQFNNGYHCEDGSMHLSCRPKKRLAIYSAIYGRTVQNRLPEKGECISPQSVSYDCTVDVLPKLVSLCHAQRKCSLPIGDNNLGNPCPRNVRKYLNLIYMCVNEKVFNEAALEGRLETVGKNENDFAAVSSKTDTEPKLFKERKKETKQKEIKKKPHLNNDAAFIPYVPPEVLNPHKNLATTPSYNFERSTMATCLPPSLPNAVGFLHELVAILSFLEGNKEKLVLYFFLSASTGLILLLACCIVQQCCHKSISQPPGRFSLDQYGSKIELESMLNSPTGFETTESRMEMSDLGRNGVSFMHFNHPTPPRTQPLQHYYS